MLIKKSTFQRRLKISMITKNFKIKAPQLSLGHFSICL